MEVYDRATSPEDDDITVEYLETYTNMHGGVTAVSAFITALLFNWSPGGLLSIVSIVAGMAFAALTGMLTVKTAAQTKLFKDIYLMERGAQARQQMQGQNGPDR